MRTHWILYQLRRRGLTGADIARRAGVSRGQVSDVMTGRRRSQKVRQLIAEALGKEVEKIFREARNDR
jgi:transcriptional regulator with XRE-family HTH domain